MKPSTMWNIIGWIGVGFQVASVFTYDAGDINFGFWLVFFTVPSFLYSQSLQKKGM